MKKVQALFKYKLGFVHLWLFPVITSLRTVLDTGPLIQWTVPWSLLATAFVPVFLCGLAHSMTCSANISWWWWRILTIQRNDLLFSVYYHINGKLLAFTEYMLFVPCFVFNGFYTNHFIWVLTLWSGTILYICQFTSEESETQIHEFIFPESYNLGKDQDLNSSHPAPEPIPNPYVSATTVDQMGECP